MTRSFSELLSEFVEQRALERDEKKQDIARRCGYSASAFAQLRSGKLKPPRVRARVLRIAQGLELTPQQADALLAAAGHERVAPLERVMGVDTATELGRFLATYAEQIELPEREVLVELIHDDTAALVAMWEGYLELRKDLYARQWPKVSEQMPHRYQFLYWPLRRLAARHFAHLSLLEAATQHHIGAFSGAIQAANQALEAARIAQEPMVQCRCHVRLADIYKSRGRYRDAEYHYSGALRILGDWSPTSPAQQRWARHWRARINRKQASLYLFRGEPDRALPLLETSIATFTELGSDYELSRAFYALGWAYSHQGRWDAAVTRFEAGLNLARWLAEQRDRPDPRQMLEGFLCLATAHWQRGNLAEAERYLDGAKVLIEGEQAVGWGGQTYHEVSRYHLLRGRVLLAKGGVEHIQAAREAFQTGIDFHLTEERWNPSRLASLYNAAGVLELMSRGPDCDPDPDALHRALTNFDHALWWANQSDPPNQYYVADVSVNACKARLALEEVPARRLELLRETQARCLEGSFWRQLARLELLWAKECSRTGDVKALAIHAAQAIAYGIRFNREVVDSEVIPQLEAIISRLPLGSDDRRKILKDVCQQLDAPHLELGTEEHDQVVAIKERLCSEG